MNKPTDLGAFFDQEEARLLAKAKEDIERELADPATQAKVLESIARAGELGDIATRANAIAEALCGSCDTLEEHTTEAERNDEALLAELDSIVFCCDQCGWWCDVGE